MSPRSEGRGQPGGSAPGERETGVLALHTVLAGLCPLIPVPLLDDVVLRRVRRSLGRELAPELDGSGSDLLIGAEARPWGCGWIAILPLRLALRVVVKLFRKLTIVLAVKEASDAASKLLHEGWLVAAAGRRGDLAHHPPPVVRAAIEAACAAVDPRPIEQILKRLFRGSRALLRRARGLLVRRDRVPLAEEQDLLRDEVQGLASEIGAKSTYFRALEQRYVEALEAAVAAATAAELRESPAPDD